MSILGNRVIRREDPRFLTGAATYIDDLRPPDAAQLVYARSIEAHARITGIDTAEAEKAPGVLGVFTGAEVEQRLGLVPHVIPRFPDEMKRSFVAVDVVRHVGQPVVAVVAETRAQAIDAAELVLIDYEPLPVVIDPTEAADDQVLLFPDLGTNVVNRMASPETADFSDSEVVVEERIENQRLTAAPIEPRGGAAWWEGERLVHYSACQGAHPTRNLLAEVFGLDNDQVRVVVPDVGGGFGAKSRTYPEELALGVYAEQLGRPVIWIETRTENLQAMPQGRGQSQQARLGGTRDGRITAYQLDVVQDAGAFPIIGAVLAGMTQRMLTGVYAIDNCGFTATTTVTNTVSITAYRGAGRPEATVAIERMIDRYAAEINMDPAEVRRINLLPRFTEPVTTGIGTEYDVGDYPKALAMALEAAGYDDLRAQQQARRAEGKPKLLGIGIGAYVEITAGAPSSEFASVELTAEGRLVVRSGATAFGQGHETTWAMIVADATGVSFDRIDVIQGDTDEVARGGLTVGSRSVQVAGTALADATDLLITRLRDHAAEHLEAAVDDIVLNPDTGAFHVIGSPSPAVTWNDLAAGLEQPVEATTDYQSSGGTFPNGVHVAVVEVDAETGAVELTRLVAVDDAGRLINPLLAEGQVHGGIAQGVAQALLEEVVYDENGNLLTSNFLDYPVISAMELPSFEVSHLETPTWVNRLGAKGVGESGTIGTIPAVYNAVIDALAPHGIRHLVTPLTPERIWSALSEA